MRITDKYVLFWSGIYSNWYPSPFQVDSVFYNCAEQYLMAGKARLFKDSATEAMILSATDPSDQKRYGRQVIGFNKDRWEKIARDIMYQALWAKFNQNADLKTELLSTGDRILVEASPKDCIWGIGLHWKEEACDNSVNWKGTNWLGETLTRVRNDIRLLVYLKMTPYKKPKLNQKRNLGVCWERAEYDIWRRPSKPGKSISGGLG